MHAIDGRTPLTHAASRSDGRTRLLKSQPGPAACAQPATHASGDARITGDACCAHGAHRTVRIACGTVRECIVTRGPWGDDDKAACGPSTGHIPLTGSLRAGHTGGRVVRSG